jgi:hypothetical protein
MMIVVQLQEPICSVNPATNQLHFKEHGQLNLTLLFQLKELEQFFRVLLLSFHSHVNQNK